MTFYDFPFSDALLGGLDAMGFNTPTPIQELAIPIILDNKDLIACAQTGTGKTAAYVLPILDKITYKTENSIDTLIIAPTRELVTQIDQQIEGFSYFTNASSCPVYGGSGANWDQQKRALTKGADVIVATPGRLIAHLKFGYVKFDKIKHLILDEADRMLDMGFLDDIMFIINSLPKKRQTLFFSATMPPKIRQLSNKILVNPETINIAISKPAAGIMQAAYVVYDDQKTPLLLDLLKGKKQKNLDSILIFCSTKKAVKSITRELQRAKVKAAAIHSDLEQQEREEVLRDYKNKKLRVLVATDVLSRGIDIDSIGLVVNYDVPGDGEDYVHRIGRTARAESKGVAITFINKRDQSKFHQIEQLIETDVNKIPVPEKFGQTPEYNPSKRSGGGKKRPFNRNKKKGNYRKSSSNKNKRNNSSGNKPKGNQSRNNNNKSNNSGRPKSNNKRRDN